jgi:uncharacterized damage-inducible protein DinB
MTNSQLSSDQVAQAFLDEARRLIKDEYVPKIERCLEKLSDDQIWWRPNDESNSIGNLLLHICGNARQWIVCGLGGEADLRDRQSEFDQRSGNRDDLLSLLKNTAEAIDQTLKEFDGSNLLDIYRIQGTEVTALNAIFHVTEHIAMHTGQIILLTKMLANVDLIFYDFSGGGPVHTWHRKSQRT